MRSTRPRRPIRALSLLVLVVLGGASVGGALLARSVLRDEQSRLLQERAVEAASTVESLFGNVGTSLPTLAATTSPQPAMAGRFTSAAHAYLGLIAGIGAAQSTPTGYRVFGAVGVSPAVGSALPADRTALASVALSSDHQVAGLVSTPAGRRMSFALAVAGGSVLYEDLAFDPTKPINLGASGPFGDLDGVLYASRLPDPAQVVVTTSTHVPLPGPVARTTVQVGGQHWLLTVINRVPLVGSFAAKAPWAVLGGGLLAAFFATGLVETLGRRREYAIGLVEERTVELRDALETQARLEQGERRAREAAEAANRAKSEFLSRMSHELRTPLNAILGFGQLLEMDELDDSQQESVDQILKGGRHLLSLINEVLDISRIETGTLALSPEPVAVADAIEEVVTLMAPLARERAVRLSSTPGAPDTAAHVQADKQRLKQILLNLVSNAIKYNHEGGAVTVTAEALDGDVRITVSDTGRGIRAEEMERLFTPFDRLGAEADGIEGTGVGLALSRALASAMGGTLDVSSTFGEGSSFWVQIPGVESPMERYERLQSDLGGDDPAADGPAGHRILYIEDNLSNLRLVERVLSRFGQVELLSAMQGRLGLDLAREARPELILLDRHLPDLDGDEVLRHLREDPATASIPVVMLSADATAGQAERLLAAGADAFLTKPLEVGELLDILTEKLFAPTSS